MARRRNPQRRNPHQGEMLLAADCPYRAATLDTDLWGEDLSRCCRGQSGTWEEPLCLTIGSEDEVYRFVWHSSFDGNAVVRIGWRGSATKLRWRYDLFREPAPDDSPAEAELSPDDRMRLLDGLLAANFWTLDSADRRVGLNGAQWLIEGRRGNVYRALSRWRPDAGIYILGKLFFDLAGPPLAKVGLY
jgi:hypothetical protein